MSGKMKILLRGNRKIRLIFNIIFIFLIVNITLVFPSTPSPSTSSGTIVSVSTGDSGDFICDGSDDQVEINNALAYVVDNSEFTTVHLKGPNTYVISDSILLGSNTVLEGDSTAVIKLEDKAGWPTEKPVITQMESAGIHDVTIKGFEIDGNHDNNDEKGRGKGYYNLIHFLNSENIQVHNMYMHDSHGDGLKVVKSSNIQFYNNTVYKLGHDALYVIYSSNVEAWNNKITCRTNSGLRIYNTNHVIFHNNIIDSEGEGGAGIEIQKDGSSTIMNDVEICNNLLDETNTAGIWVTGYGPEYSKDSAKDLYIHHNKFYKTGINQNADWSGGIVLNGFQNTLIENNIFDGCYGAAIAHKEVTDEFAAPGSGYTTVVKNNVIINTQPSYTAGEGYAMYNKLRSTHSFVLKNNCLSNNTGGNYKYTSSTSDVEADPELVTNLGKNESLREDSLWGEAMSAGPKRPYQIEENKTQIEQEEDTESIFKRIFSKIVSFLNRFFSSLSIDVDETDRFKTVLPSVVSDNRLKEESPNTTFRESEYIDVGKSSDGGIYRDVILFDLSSLNKTDHINKAELSFFWYYPENRMRSEDTVLEVYRPVKWCEEHATWEEKESKIPWNNSGGDWYDINEVLQGNTPYATITISGEQTPDNRYYDLDITELVQEYVSKKYENTGFLIKAHGENENYIAFYSSNWQNKNQRPQLSIELNSP